MKLLSVMHNVGRAKYLVTYHKEGNKHKDGSDFHDIAIFSNKKNLNKFIKTLDNDNQND